MITESLENINARIEKGEDVVERLRMELRDMARSIAFKQTELTTAVSELNVLKTERRQIEINQIIADKHSDCSDGRCLELNGRGPCRTQADLAKAKENAEAVGPQKARWV